MYVIAENYYGATNERLLSIIYIHYLMTASYRGSEVKILFWEENDTTQLPTIYF